MTFIENYQYKFKKEPMLKSIRYIAYIISWNVWQMDGLKGVIPNSCTDKKEKVTNLFGETSYKIKKCEGCLKDNIYKHNGIYSVIKDWKTTGKKGRKIRFIDLIEGY